MYSWDSSENSCNSQDIDINELFDTIPSEQLPEENSNFTSETSNGSAVNNELSETDSQNSYPSTETDNTAARGQIIFKQGNTRNPIKGATAQIPHKTSQVGTILARKIILGPRNCWDSSENSCNSQDIDINELFDTIPSEQLPEENSNFTSETSNGSAVNNELSETDSQNSYPSTETDNTAASNSSTKSDV
ncbi:hypothetical protein Glove_38g27 [Diversispora epigaea]|uniref:Uncharacterized protein n=1 Tax=Diversispora epigaea TaxID=1348612 RepID=A0A397JQM4_9GLOM|nr:hypothetical protein Glove_38g27 [Diversispora epigaea]